MSNINIPRVQEQCQDEAKYEIMVRKFSDIMCENLQDTSRRQLAMRQARNMSSASDGEIRLERVRRKDGNIIRLQPSKQMLHGRTAGTANNRNCYTCRNHLT